MTCSSARSRLGWRSAAAVLYELLAATPFADEPEEAVDTSRSLETTVAALTQMCGQRSR